MSKGKSSPTPIGMYGARILRSSSTSDILVLSRCRDKKGAMLLSTPESPGLHNEGKLQSPGLWKKQKDTQMTSLLPLHKTGEEPRQLNRDRTFNFMHSAS